MVRIGSDQGDNREAFMEIHSLLNTWLILWYDHFCGRDRSLHMPHDLFRRKENMLAYAEHDHHKILETLQTFHKNLPTAIAKLQGTSNTFMFIPPINMQIDAQQIKCGKKIGKGAYGLVREAYWLGCNFAVKIMRTSNIDALRKEVWILAKLSHPHIVQLVGFSADGLTSMILMELMDGDLHHRIKSIGASSPGTPPFSPEETINIISQIAAGMAYLHEREVFHGDLKASNVLVNHRGGNIEVKIADFGVSQTVQLTKRSDISKQNDGNVGSSSVYSNSSGVVGTIGWRAPEISHVQAKEGDTLLVKPTYTGKADVFSFAMTCYEVVTGNLPYSSDIPRQSIEKLVREGVRPELPKDMNRRLSNLIKKCWKNEAAERPTFEKICFDLQEIKALEITAPKKPTVEETRFDLQEMKTLETVAPKKPTVEESCFDLQQMKALEREAPKKHTFEVSSFDLQEMKTLETVAPKKPTVEESCFDLQQMKALEREAPKRHTLEVSSFDLQVMQTLQTKALRKPTIEETCFDLQKMNGLKIIAQGRQKSWCTII